VAFGIEEYEEMGEKLGLAFYEYVMLMEEEEREKQQRLVDKLKSSKKRGKTQRRQRKKKALEGTLMQRYPSLALKRAAVPENPNEGEEER